MSLSDLASLASVISGLAVLVSLVFLYFQMRQFGAQLAQSEKNQRTAINESYATRASEALRWMAEPAIATLMSRITHGERSFSAEELRQLHVIFRTATLNALAATQHYEAGLIDRASYEFIFLSFKDYLRQPVYRAIWARQAAITAPSFRKLVEDMLHEIPLAEPADTLVSFNNDLAKVLAESAAPATRVA